MKKFVRRLFRNIKNFLITSTDGKKYWISRSIAVHGILLLKNFETGEVYVLLERRGPNCPDEIGKLANVCGYLDWRETLVDALKREVYEETGLYIDDLKTKNIKFSGIDDSIDGENAVKQNVTIRYEVTLDYKEVMSLLESGEINCDTKSRGGESGEVSEIKVLKLTDSDPVDETQFAFNHGQIINSIIEHYKKW